MKNDPDKNFSRAFQRLCDDCEILFMLVCLFNSFNSIFSLFFASEEIIGKGAAAGENGEKLWEFIRFEVFSITGV
jgi:hypothetical protein